VESLASVRALMVTDPNQEALGGILSYPSRTVAYGPSHGPGSSVGIKRVNGGAGPQF